MIRKTSKELLAESFRELAQSKKIDKITIGNITSNCGYSTATFYRQFKDKYDLIAWSYTRDIEKIINQINSTQSSWEKTLISAADYYEEHRDYLTNLLLHNNGYLSFMRYMTDINYESFKKKITELYDETEIDSKTDMYIRLYCQGTVALTCDWILGKYRISTNELAEIYANAVPQPLSNYLENQKK